MTVDAIKIKFGRWTEEEDKELVRLCVMSEHGGETD